MCPLMSWMDRIMTQSSRKAVSVISGMPNPRLNRRKIMKGRMIIVTRAAAPEIMLKSLIPVSFVPPPNIMIPIGVRRKYP